MNPNIFTIRLKNSLGTCSADDVNVYTCFMSYERVYLCLTLMYYELVSAVDWIFTICKKISSDMYVRFLWTRHHFFSVNILILYLLILPAVCNYKAKTTITLKEAPVKLFSDFLWFWTQQLGFVQITCNAHVNNWMQSDW